MEDGRTCLQLVSFTLFTVVLAILLFVWLIYQWVYVGVL